MDSTKLAVISVNERVVKRFSEAVATIVGYPYAYRIDCDLHLLVPSIESLSKVLNNLNERVADEVINSNSSSAKCLKCSFVSRD